jgi:hypothetical protein
MRVFHPLASITIPQAEDKTKTAHSSIISSKNESTISTRPPLATMLIHE